MIEPRRLQRHLRETLRLGSSASRVGPFTVLLHPDSTAEALNVAIPDEPTEGRRVHLMGVEASGAGAVPDDDPGYALMMLEARFRATGRRPRVEFLEECHPDLVATLHERGFEVDERLPLLVAMPPLARAPPAVDGVRFEAVLPRTPWPLVRRYLLVQRDAHGLDLRVPEDAPRDAWARLGIGAGVLALRGDEPIAAGGFSAPEDGLVEIRGLAVVPAARSQGVGAFLLHALARVALEGGVEGVVAVPDGPATARLARRAGFTPAATLVSFRAADAAAP